MRYYRLLGREGERRLAVETENGILRDMTSVDEDVLDVEYLAGAAAHSQRSIDDVAMVMFDSGEAETLDLAQVIGNSRTPRERRRAGVVAHNSYARMRRVAPLES